MKNALVATVAVEGTVFHFDKPYDYLIPKSFSDCVKIGCRVMVPFGAGNRKRQAMVLDIKQTSEFDKLKPIVSLIDKTPILSNEMLNLAEWMKEHLFCTYYDAFKPMLPAGINVRIVESYRINDNVDINSLEGYSQDEINVLTLLNNSKGTIEKDKLLSSLGLDNNSKVLEKLIVDNLILRTDDAVRKINDASIKMVKVNTEVVNNRTLTAKQKTIIEFIELAGSASVKEVGYFTGCAPATITNMVKKELLIRFDNIVYRNPYTINNDPDTSEIELTENQNIAYKKLKQLYMSDKGAAALLYGVTGSGKTSVFMKLVDDAFRQNKGSIVMVPEISLTPQTLNLFHKRYGGKVAVFHSAMSLGQRMDEWKRVKNGDALVAIGTRSAVFAPFENLGVIIIDEEQEHTYKSEQTPRFHARDVARFRCAYSSSLLVLSSATPSVETYSAAKEGRYHLCTLSERYGNASLPTVHTVDMREEVKQGNKSIFSNLLIERLTKNLNENKQSILLLNRRGHNTFISCSYCGHVISCPHCSISLTYHSANDRLMCHYCGYSEPNVKRCSECGSEHIRLSGEGTQKAEQELKLLFPTARVLRMDADSTLAKNSYEQNLNSFANKEYDIMLGTQMVAKGLNFPDVTLVGVLNADSSLYSEDYKAFERTFSLLTQVVGRSGRGDKKGEAIIQTYTPENEIISLASKQDYDSFYDEEILTRKVMTYPPYCSMCLVGVSGGVLTEVKDVVTRFIEALKNENDKTEQVKMIVLGPSVANKPKLGGKYRYRLLIKVKNNKDFRLMMKKVLCDFSKTYNRKTVSLFVDINPENVF